MFGIRNLRQCLPSARRRLRTRNGTGIFLAGAAMLVTPSVACRDQGVVPAVVGPPEVQAPAFGSVSLHVLPEEETDAARASLSGPTDATVTLTATARGFEKTISDLLPGTYTVTVEGLVGSEVTYFSRVTGVAVVAGDTAETRIELGSFVSTLEPFTSPTTSLTIPVNFSAVPNATSYVIETDTDPAFATAEGTTVTTAEALVFARDTAVYYLRVRAVNDAVSAGAARSSAVQSVQILTDLSPSGDDAETAANLGSGVAASGVYEQLSIFPTDDEDWFAVDLARGDALTADVRSTSLSPLSGLDPVLALFDESGNLLTDNNDAAANTLESRLESLPIVASGRHLLVVTGLGGQSVGHYELEVLVVGGGAAAVPFSVLEEVHTSLVSTIRDRRHSVIRTATEWEQFWNELQGAVQPRPELPLIDFDENMVIVAAMGQRPTGGYSIEVEDVLGTDGGLAVQVVESSPSPTCLVAQAVTMPVTAVVVTRTDGLVTFVEETRTHECSGGSAP